MLVAVAYAAEVAAEHSSVAGQIAGTFGLDLRLFLAQLLNFGLIIFLFTRFVYKPLKHFMDARTERIAEGLEHERRYAEKIKQIEAERITVLAKAEGEAKEIILKAQTLATSMNDTARVAAEALMAEARARLEREAELTRQESIEQVRRDAADLVVLAAEKVLREKIDAVRDRELIERALKDTNL